MLEDYFSKNFMKTIIFCDLHEVKNEQIVLEEKQLNSKLKNYFQQI